MYDCPHIEKECDIHPEEGENVFRTVCDTGGMHSKYKWDMMNIILKIVLHFFSKYSVAFSLISSNIVQHQIFFNQTYKMRLKDVLHRMSKWNIDQSQYMFEIKAWRKICFSQLLKMFCINWKCLVWCIYISAIA